MLMHRHDSGWHDMIFSASVRHVSTCCTSWKKHEWLVIIDEFFNKKHERQI